MNDDRIIIELRRLDICLVENTFDKEGAREHRQVAQGRRSYY